MITRRRFVLAGSWLVLPAAHAQQSKALKKVGVLHTRPANDPRYQAFLAGLAELGYIDGKTITIDFRHTTDNAELPSLAEALVRANVDLIYAPTPPVAVAALKATTRIPIVVAALGDPVSTGLIKSFSLPGGNLTGLTALGSNLSGKRLEILKQIIPAMVRVGVVWNPAIPDKVVEWKEIQEPARVLKLELVSIEARTAPELNTAIEVAVRSRLDGLIALADPLVFAQRARIIEAALDARLPLMMAWEEGPEGGALIGYGANVPDLYRRSASYVDKIFKGARAGELPVEDPARFDFVVNLRTAKLLGIAIPRSIVLRATKLIE